MLYALIAVVIVGAVVVFMKLAGNGSTASETRVPFSGATLKSKPVLNATEFWFYESLLKALPPGYLVFPQVRLADLLAISGSDTRARQSSLSRVSSKSVDFAIVRVSDLICERVIELDGPYHQKKAQQERDEVKNAALQHAGIKILRLPAGDYSPADLVARLTGQSPSSATIRK